MIIPDLTGLSIKVKNKKSVLAGFNPISYNIIRRFNKTRSYKACKNLCNAPFRNLYFSANGQVSVCCYNMQYIVGDIKNNSITEIWNSEKIKKLREHIANNDLSLGCGACKSELFLQNFENLHIKLYDTHFAISNFPTSLGFQIDNSCNLECTMCSGDLSSKIFLNREHRTLIKNMYDENFIKQLSEFIPHLKFCLFSGGEPFVINSYYRIWEMIIQHNPLCNIVVQTNGTILNDKIKNLLEKGTFNISVSIDSLNQETYEKIRVNAKLDTTLKNLGYFKDYCHANNRFIGLSVCVMNQNWMEIPKITEFCSMNNINIIFNTVRFPAKDALWILNSNELKEIIDYYGGFLFTTKTDVQKRNKKSFENLINLIVSWYNIALKFENHKHVTISEKEFKPLIDELILKLETSLNVFYDGNNMKQAYCKSIINKIMTILNNIPNDDIKYRSITIINSFNGEKILANIFRENDESLVKLIKNISKYAEM